MSRDILRMVGYLVKSSHKGNHLVFAGQRYCKNNDNAAKTITNWHCVKRSTCKGTISSFYVDSNELRSNSEIDIIKIGIMHIHETEKEGLAAEEVVRGIKRRAESNPNEPPLKIMQEE